jgi:FAD/FMN-containing dehydrogenase
MKHVPGRLTRRAFLRTAASLAGVAGIGAAARYRPARAASELRVYNRGEAGYEDMRRALVWQAIKPDRYPARIVEAQSADDVVAALASARSENRRVSVVSCGHNYVGTGVRGGTVLIHLANLQEVIVDKAARIAALQPGVRAMPFDALLEREGLAFPIPHSATVGLAGFLLGGGMGWNAESWNYFACFNLRSIEAVLPSGESVTADSTRHPDLFWAARGGGPYFPAVVTRFHVNVFPRPGAIRENTWVYSIDAAPAVIAWLEKVHPLQDPKVELTVIFATSDPADTGGKAEKQCIVSLVCFGDTAAESKHLYEVLADGAPREGVVFKELQKPVSIRTLLLEDKASIPNRHCVETLWTNRPAVAAHILAKHFLSVPSPKAVLVLNYRARPVVPSGGAYSIIGSAFAFSDVSWDDPKDDAVCQRWSDEFVASVSAIDKGAYINETEIVRHPARARRCYSAESWHRLKHVVARYDPQGLFVSPLNP